MMPPCLEGVRANIPHRATMALSGHKNRSNFDGYENLSEAA